MAPLQIPPEAGPRDDDPSTVHFPYYSTVDLVPHQYSGLVGVFVVATPGTLAADGALFEYSNNKPSKAADVLHICTFAGYWRSTFCCMSWPGIKAVGAMKRSIVIPQFQPRGITSPTG